MGWTIGVLRFDYWQGLGIFLFTTMARMGLGPTQPLLSNGYRDSFPGGAVAGA